MSVFSRLGAALWARRTTTAIWAAIILVIFAVVSYNRTAAARTEAALSSPEVVARDAEVRTLVTNGRLVDALAATENPNDDVTSPQNTKSVAIRQNAVDALNRLTAARQLPDVQALDALFLLRKDADQGVKDRATAGLAALGAAGEADLNLIVDRLKDGDPDIRSAAVDALSKIGGAATARKIDPLLKDPAAQDSAQIALQNIGGPSVPLLLMHLTDPDLAFRQRIVGMLGQIAAPQSVPDLMRVARSDAPSVRRLALVALADTVLNNYNSAEAAAANMRRVAVGPDPKHGDVQKAEDAARKAAANFARARAAEPALVGAVGAPDDDSEARTQSALALGRLGSPLAVSTLVVALGDYDARVRLAALQGVQSAGTIAVAPLTAVLARGQEVTRAASAQALGGIGDGPAVAALQRVLADPATPVPVRRSAVVGLGQSGNPAVVSTLVASLADPDGGVASAAADALTIPALEPSAITPLIASFTKTAPVPFNASQTLSRMGSLPVAALKAAVASGMPRTQQWAAITLGQTDSRDPTIAAALTPLTKSANAGVQYAATQALDRLSGT